MWCCPLGSFRCALLDPLQNYRAAFLDRALLINPNFARGWSYSGWVKVWLGEPDRAIEHIARAMRLSFLMKQAMARAHFSAGRHDEARAWAKMALRERPDSQIGLLASLLRAARLLGMPKR